MSFHSICRWTYQSESKLEGRSFWGKLTSYSGGGFVQLLGKRKAESKAIIADLKVIDMALYKP